MNKELINKYNVAGPRYTSYPTVPYWDVNPTETEWLNSLTDSFYCNQGRISLYIHLPYCESLCTYCGCNTRITVNHGVELPYIDSILKEWKMYVERLPGKPIIRELHLGGGTPTFFSPANLQRLIDGIFLLAERDSDAEFSIEGHPKNTTEEHLRTLHALGFRRISFGIQDFDGKVQDIINRKQSFEQVKKVTEISRSVGFTSVNYDLVYGLPLQTKEGVRDTVAKVVELKPDRIAFYSYAHVPWMKPGQRRYTEADLPSGELKRALYEESRAAFETAGYGEIGMDHFALPGDELYKAALEGKLHRNFMGYTTCANDTMIGLGVSSISDSWTCFAQNVKVVEEYQSLVASGALPIYRGHLLNEEDLIVRWIILDIMCRFKAVKPQAKAYHSFWIDSLARLTEMSKDGLVEIESDQISVTEEGRAFVRNICMAFDVRLWRKEPVTRLFSQTV